jgi:hypothetical protein
MTVVYDDGQVRLLHGDVRHLDLPAGSAAAVVTSPPYNVGRAYDGVTDVLAWPDYWSLAYRACEVIAGVLVAGGRAWVNTRIPDGGGWRVHGRAAVRIGRDQRSRGMSYVHSAIDAHSRLAFSEIHNDERGPTCSGFFARARAFFADHGISRIEAVLTDNAKAYLSRDFQAALEGAEHRRIRPYTPRTNGKVERFNRTLLDEWAYVRPYESDDERTAALDDWLHLYNHHRHHTAIDASPISRVNNLPGQHLAPPAASALAATGRAA